MSATEDYTIQKLNLLAFPRNFTPLCELTGEHATVELITAHITLYYVSEAAARQSWYGIIHKISHLLSPLRSDPPIIGTAEEREIRAKHILACKRSLIEYCLSEASSLISHLKFDLAVPGATQALKLSKELDGEFSLAVVEPMLLLSQAFLGLNQLKQAEEYLALARWNVINTEGCSDKTLARLHTLLGRVLTAQGNFNGAKDELAQGIYFSSRSFGAESIPTSIGYYRLGDIFLAQGNKESALAFFDKVVDIWYKYLLNLMNVEGINPGSLASLSTSTSLQEPLSDENYADGGYQLLQILSVRQTVIGDAHIATGEVMYTIGLFEYLYRNDSQTAIHYIQQAYEIYEKSLYAEHQSTIQLANVLQMIQARSESPLLQEQQQRDDFSISTSSLLPAQPILTS